MKNIYLKTSVVLGSICAVAAILLAFVNMITKPVIEENEFKALIEARKAVSCGMEIGGAKTINYVDAKSNCEVISVVELLNNNKVEGYILELSSNGYGGKIELTASFDSDGKVLAVKLGTNSETPGLGKRYEKDENLLMFINTGSSSSVPTNKKALSTDDQALVSGATVSFTGIAKALSVGSSYVKSLKGGK